MEKEMHEKKTQINMSVFLKTGLCRRNLNHGDHINSKVKIQDIPVLSRTFF